METNAEDGSARERIQTYVPAYQKDEWVRHADELDMSLSEFVKSMIQAGRRGFSGGSGAGSSAPEPEPRSMASSSRDPGGEGLEDRVEAILSNGGFYDWDELVAALTDDVEDRLEETLREMQADDRVVYSGRNGGYTLE